MQEQSLMRPSVLTDYGKVRNIITAVCLGLSLPLMAWLVLSTGYEEGPSIMWGLVSDALKSGVLYINDGTLFFTLLLYFPLGIWSFVSFMLSLLNYRWGKPQAKKSTILWAGILLGVIILLMAFFFVITGPVCVEQNWNGNGSCGLPIHPGVVVPKPVFPQS